MVKGNQEKLLHINVRGNVRTDLNYHSELKRTSFNDLIAVASSLSIEKSRILWLNYYTA